MRPTSNALIGSGLAFAAAWTDTVGFVALFGLFTAHVTGNFVIIGATIVQSGRGATDDIGLATKIAALPIFVLGAVVATLFVRRRQRAGLPAAAMLLLIEASVLLLALISGCVASSTLDTGKLWFITASASAVLAMGIQNAAGRLVFPQLSPTTVMTVNVAQLSIDVVDMLSDFRGATQTGQEARARAARLAPPVIVFAIAALAAAFAYRSFGFGCMVVPVILLCLLSQLVPSN